MSRYWIGRVLETIPLLFGVALLAFTLFWLAPGDPVALVVDPTLISQEDRERILDDLGVNDPYPVQFAKMMTSLVSGDLRSFKSKQPTIEIVRDAFRITALVGLLGMGVAVVFAAIFGTIAAKRPGGGIDRIISASMVVTIAAPPFLVGILMIRLFTEELRWFPGSGISPPGTIGFDPQLRYLVMPVALVAISPATILARYLRDALVTVLNDDYIRTARAKGLNERAIVARHAIRNAVIPVLALLNTLVPAVLGGSVIIESVFGLPGLGRVTTQAALSRDYPVVLTCVIFVAVITVGINLLVDLLYGVIDPRARVGTS